MALKARVENLEGITEDQRGLYVEREGAYFLDVEPVDGYELQDVSGLKSSLEREREQRRKANNRLSTFVDPEGQPLSMDLVTKTFDRVSELETQIAANGKVDVNKLVEEKSSAKISQLVDNHKTEVQTLSQERDSLEGEISSLLIDSVLTREIENAGGIPQLLLGPMKTLKDGTSRFRMEKDAETRRRRVSILNEKGEPRIGDSEGKDFAMSQLVEEFRADPLYGAAFKGSGSSGSENKIHDKTAGGAGGVKSRSKMTTQEKSAFISAKGLEEFKALPE